MGVTIDIRNTKETPIEQITFADYNNSGAFYLRKDPVVGLDIHDVEDYVAVTSKADAENLIKALEKAIELGWLND